MRSIAMGLWHYSQGKDSEDQKEREYSPEELWMVKNCIDDIWIIQPHGIP